MDVKSKPRRRHSAQFKAEVIAACQEPGVSVAEVARKFDLNDNLVHQWRRGRGANAAGFLNANHSTVTSAEFVALSLPALAVTATPTPASAPALDQIRIEIKRGSTTVNLSWPSSAAGDCAGWLRELLR